MDKFTIGGDQYDAVVTYRVRRFFIENSTEEKIKAMSFEQSEDMVLDAILMCLKDKTVFKNRDELMDVLSNDEFKKLNKRFGDILNPDVEGKTDIEKKSGATTGTSNTSSADVAGSQKKGSSTAK